MKTKLFTILIFSVLFQQAYCQLDTLFVGDREPTYYYWDTNWWDYQFLNQKDILPDSPGDFRLRYYAVGLGPNICKVEFARPCIADSTIRILGIAACLVMGHPESPDRLPEYLRLYQRKYNEDGSYDYELLSEGRWDTVEPRYYMCVDTFRLYQDWKSTYVPVREVRFPNPIDIKGEFFLSMTGNNNYRHGVPYTGTYNGEPYYDTIPADHVCGVGGVITTTTSRLDRRLWPAPGYYMYRAHLIDEFNFETTLYVDTNWHEVWGARFINIFAIIDTSKHTGSLSACDRPQEMRVLGTWPDHSVIAWSDAHNGPWEVAYGRNGLTDSTAETMIVNTHYTSIYGLEPYKRYCVCVRSLCDSSQTSEWSDTLCFVTNDHNGTTGIEEAQLQLGVQLSPNPSTGRVTVTASVMIEDVEVYSMQGVRMQRTPVHGMTADIDISRLPQGMYLVRVNTTQGAAHKKLVKN